MTDTTTGRFVWYELLTTDPKAAIAFYSEVVGWKTQLWEDGGYTMWVGSQGPLGGVMTLPDKAKQMGAPPHWMAHVEVADVDKTVARVRQLGGNVYLEPEDVPKIGRFAIIADPQGASLSAFKPLTPMAPRDMEKHGAVCWHELMTTDQPAALRFYAWDRWASTSSTAARVTRSSSAA
jgi:predicted enzyme related to lactoylglutathione lyase